MGLGLCALANQLDWNQRITSIKLQHACALLLTTQRQIQRKHAQRTHVSLERADQLPCKRATLHLLSQTPRLACAQLASQGLPCCCLHAPAPCPSPTWVLFGLSVKEALQHRSELGTRIKHTNL